MVYGLTALNVTIIRTGHGFAVGETSHNVIGQADLDIEIGQHVIVAAAELREVAVAGHCTELITAHPVDALIAGRESLGVNIGVLVAYTQANIHRDGAQIKAHIYLQISCQLLLGSTAIRAVVTGRAQTGTAIPHVGDEEGRGITAGHELLGTVDHIHHVVLKVLGLEIGITAPGYLIKAARRIDFGHQVGNSAGLGNPTPGIALYHRARRPVIHLGELNTEVNTFHHAFRVKVKGTAQARLLNIHLGVVVTEDTARDDHVVSTERVGQVQGQHG